MNARFRNGLDNILAFAFNPPSANLFKRPQIIFVVLVFLMGGGFWWSFLRCQGADLFYHAIDWGVEQQYYHIIQEAYQTKQIPYHVSVEVQPLQPTQRFLAVPESLYWLAPQAPLLAFMTLKHFVMVNVLLHFAVGFYGCLLLRRRFDFSPIAFFVLVLLFNLNGHIIAHVAAGHKWNGYFYLAMFAAFVFDALERKAPVFETSIKISLVTLFILLQGTLHLYALCLMLLGLVFVFSNKARGAVFVAGVLTILLSLFRLAPAAMSLNKIDTTDFIAGFNSLRMLIGQMYSPALYPDTIFPWEYDFYIGPVGLAFLIIFGILLAFSFCPELRNSRFLSLTLCLLVLLFLSLDNFYEQLINHLPNAIPNTERVPSRFMIMPLVFLAVMASVRMQKLYQFFMRIRWLGAIILLAVAALLLQLCRHAALWRMSSTEYNYQGLVEHLPLPHIITLSDPAYINVIHASFLFSLLTLLATLLIWLQQLGQQRRVSSLQMI